jgi:hypothetical protein
MFHPPSWTKTTFHKRACYNEGLSKEFTGYLINAERAELEKLAKLTGSDSRDKIGTFMNIKLPIVCELEIRYTIPIHHQETSTTTYICMLRSVRSKDHFIQKEYPRWPMFLVTRTMMTRSVVLSQETKTSSFTLRKYEYWNE